jgi:hypothetical protein
MIDKWLFQLVKQEFACNFPASVISSQETFHQDESEGLLTSLSQVGSNVAFNLTKFPAYPLASKLQIATTFAFYFPIWIVIYVALHSIGSPEFTPCQNTLMSFLYYYTYLFLATSMTSFCIKFSTECIQTVSKWQRLIELRFFCVLVDYITFALFFILLSYITFSKNCYAHMDTENNAIRPSAFVLLDMMLQVVMIYFVQFILRAVIHHQLPHLDTVLSMNTLKIKYPVSSCSAFSYAFL